MLSVAQLDERIERCLAILADNPRSQVFAALADAYRKRGELGRAFSVCKGGLKNHPNYAPAHIVMAKLFMHQSMYDAAMQSLQKAVTIDGRTHVSDQLEAEILIAGQQFQQAREVVERLRSTDPGNPAVREIEIQLQAVMQPSASPFANRLQSMSGSPSPVVAAPNRHDTDLEPIDWSEWADRLAARANVRKAFAISLTAAATTPIELLAESGKDRSGEWVGICAAMFTSVDSETRNGTRSTVDELRVEFNDGIIWCHRYKGCIIGFVGQQGMMFGAIRQHAVESAAQVRMAELTE